MKYEIDVDNDKQQLLVLKKDHLDWLWNGIQGSDEDQRVCMTFLMCELGLLDDRFKPVWR